jgi:hypothetical protein
MKAFMYIGGPETYFIFFRIAACIASLGMTFCISLLAVGQWLTYNPESILPFEASLRESVMY